MRSENSANLLRIAKNVEMHVCIGILTIAKRIRTMTPEHRHHNACTAIMKPQRINSATVTLVNAPWQRNREAIATLE